MSAKKKKSKSKTKPAAARARAQNSQKSSSIPGPSVNKAVTGNGSHRRGTRAGQAARKKKPTGLFPRVRRAFGAMKKELPQSDALPKAIFFTVVMLLVFGSIYLLTNKNAYGVMVGTEQVAVIKKDKKITSDDLLKAAVEKVETDLGTTIKVQEEIRFARVHSAKKDMQTPDSAILKIADRFTYTIEAVAINVGETEENAITMAIVKNWRDAEDVEASLFDQYPYTNKIVEKGFVEYFSMDKVYVTMEEIVTVEKALNILTVTTPSAEPYTVQSGDTLQGIAGKFSMSIENLLAINPNHSMNSVLQIGEQLTVHTAKPLLSVRTVEEYTLTEVEPAGTDRRDNPNMNRGQVRTVQYGSDGQADVTYHLVRVNGIETERKEVSRVITTPPVNELIDVGTR